MSTFTPVYGSPALQWQLIRSFNCFKRVSPIAGVPALSAERNNLMNVHSAKYSAVATSAVVGVESSANGGIRITTSLPSVGKHTLAKACKVQSVRKGASSRYAQKAAFKACQGSRFDLRQAAIQRASALSAIGHHKSKTQHSRHKAAPAAKETTA